MINLNVTIINNLPFLKHVFGILFFLMLLTLAIDSAFSLVEAVASAVEDKFGWSKQKTNIVVALFAFTIGLLFTTGSGLYWLDITDHFVTTIGLGLACFVECIILGWIFGTDKLKDHVNLNSSFKVGSWWDICIKYVSPILIAWFFINELIDRFKSSYENYGRIPEFLGGWMVLVMIIVVAVVFSLLKPAKNE